MAIHHRWTGFSVAGATHASTEIATANPSAQIRGLWLRNTAGHKAITANPPPTVNPKDRSCGLLIFSERIGSSVELELGLPIRIVCQRLLLVLVKDAVLEHEHVHLGSHEAAVRILG